MDFRGATVEDLNLPPPHHISESTRLCDAAELVLLGFPLPPPVVPVFRERSVVGYLTSQQLESEHAEDTGQLVGKHMHPYEPAKTRLCEPLESLLATLQHARLVAVYDADMSTLLATVTMYDLTRRYPRLSAYSDSA